MEISKDLSFDEQTKLLQVAREAVKNAYAPYSEFRVGAAVLTEKDNIFSGCNIENASYGLTICAERAAICSAVANEGGNNMRIRAICVVNDKDSNCSPCGACRQVIYEFGPNAIVIFRGHDGLVSAHATELLPNGFVSFDQSN
ncbi:MAG: cytidine deaminase [Thermodesulfobacteriota bacterium]